MWKICGKNYHIDFSLISDCYTLGIKKEEEVNVMTLKTKDLTKTYQANSNMVKAVDGVNIEVEKGEYIAVCGQSGAGKSTLMHLLGGLDLPTSGDVTIDGISVYGLDEKQRTVFRRNKIGFVFQAFNLLPYLTVWENIILPLSLGRKPADPDFLDQILETLGLGEKKSSRPDELSGGQRQRVAIARALITHPSILIADEPTGNLDSQSSANVMQMLKKSCEVYKQTLLVVTHNEQIAEKADRIIWMKDGRIV